MLVICREFILRIPLFYSSILLHKINDHCTNCIWGAACIENRNNYNNILNNRIINNIRSINQITNLHFIYRETRITNSHSWERY